MTKINNAEAQYFMRLAMREAEKARGTCAPNPFVGAVIVANKKVISKGHTQSWGCDHAEVQAIKKAGSASVGADIYVTLEPCSHWGKTPPCTEAIITAGIKRVFYGISDPNPLVNPFPNVEGPGIISMRKHGIEVYGGWLEFPIRKQLEAWLCRIEKSRPFVTWKIALSMDGKYAAADGTSRWITGVDARQYVHKLRSWSDVIVTGIGTVLADDPMLNARISQKAHQPVRAVLDSYLRIPIQSALVQSAKEYPLYIFHSQGCTDSKIAKLEDAGAKLFQVPSQAGRLDLGAILNILHDLGYYSVMTECGDILSTALLKASLVDKVMIFLGPKLLGGSKSILTGLERLTIEQALCLEDIAFQKIGSDLLVTAYPRY
jgi:diaminohydroxyphosphoribosylaminopyrimidine deaminase/5-amino-6-(5-phosphoribosylamino)uracil reductase